MSRSEVTSSRTGASGLVEAARSGSRLALARLLTAVESRTPLAEGALRELYPLAGSAHIVGVTGPPGSGKSTLVAALVRVARTDGRAVAVVAIDPSSPITGGAILGDRIRMQEHAGDRHVFIRSMAARGHLGGLAGTTAEAAAVLDACGFGLILIETVGTGQSEVEVASLADTTVVVQAPEMGDEIQAIKAGLLEVADIVVVNKADRPGAERTAAELRSMLAPGRADADVGASRSRRPDRPDVLLVSGLTAQGVPELLVALDGRSERLSADPDASLEVRLARAEAQVMAILDRRVRVALRTTDLASRTDLTLRAVASHELDPYGAAQALLSSLGIVDGS